MIKLSALIFTNLFAFTLFAQSWQTMQNIPVDLAFPVVVELRGNIHVLGGGASGGASDLHLRYTPATNTWDTLPPVPYLAQQPAGAVVNEKIHFCGGGYPTTGQRLDFHYYYDPDSVQWYQAASMPVATAIHKAVSFDGKMYVLSGQPDKYLCEYYDPASDTWTQRNPLPDQNFWYGAIASNSNSIYRYGGGAYFSPSNSAHSYDKINDTWISLPNFPETSHASAAVNIGDSLICISGGYANGAEKKKVWIYDISAQAYYPSDSLPVARNYHSMVRVDSCLFSVGGYHSTNSTVGVSLLKNCSPSMLTSVSSIDHGTIKPYSVIITPNQIQFSFHSTSTDKPAAIKIIDISGRTVLYRNIKTHTGSYSISSSEFETGIYLAILVIENITFTETWMVGR